MDDEELARVWSKVLNNDTQACVHLWTTFSPFLVAEARRYHLLNAADADEIVSDVFRIFFDRAWKGKYRISDHDSFRNLLRSILKGDALDLKRKLAKRKAKLSITVCPNDKLENLKNTISRSNQEMCQRSSDVNAVRDALDKLSDDDRIILEHVIAGHSTSTIAEQFGLEPHAASMRIHRAKIRLRLALGENFLGNPERSST